MNCLDLADSEVVAEEVETEYTAEVGSTMLEGEEGLWLGWDAGGDPVVEFFTKAPLWEQPTSGS